ncbi:unnamed protein product [Chrysoparadoxa australica]
MNTAEKQNANPIVFAARKQSVGDELDLDESEGEEGCEREPIDADEVFEMIRNINDPEHPLTLEQLQVATVDQVEVEDNGRRSWVKVQFTPTIPHCSMATLIGLSIRVKLLRSLPARFKVSVEVKEGTHSSAETISKQLNDKERVAAALENTHLLAVLTKCIDPDKLLE